MARVFVVYYSLYGHVHRMPDPVAEGARSIGGTELITKRVSETLSLIFSLEIFK